MSAYKKIQCEIVDKSFLLDALALLGLQPETHDTPQSLKGYLNDIRKEKAEIIVPKEQLNNKFTKASNDIGFSWNESAKKYDFYCSEYDKAMKMDSKIYQAYVKVVLENSLAKNGYKIKVNISDEDFLKNQSHVIEISARKIV